MQNILKSKIFLSTLLTVVVAAIAVVIVINVRNPNNDLQAQLDLGEKYVSELDYENAVIAYEAALKIDPYCLEAYLGLSDAYMALGQPDKALDILKQAKNMLPDDVEIYVYLAQLYASQNQIDLAVSILEEGIRVTDSDQLREMLKGYQTDEQVELAKNDQAGETDREENTEEEQDAEADEEAPAVTEPRANNRRQNTVPVITIQQDDTEPIVIPLTMQVNNDAWNEAGNGEERESDRHHSDSDNESNHVPETNVVPALPQTGITGNVYGADGMGIEGVMINVYSAQGDVLFSASTDTIGKYMQSLSAGTYTIVLSKEGYVDLSTSVSVLSNVLTSYNYIMLTNEESLQSASLSGIVINATNSQQIEGVTITLLQGFDHASDGNQQVMESSNHTMTDSNGAFSMNEGINAGYYTVEASKDGYSVYQHNETIKPGENVLDISMSPVIQIHGVYRIVLTWGESPRDLDSHLICNGNSSYHVYYGNKNSQDGNASLDWDDTSSYGPETVTVQIEEGSSYIYAVHNFSNSGAVQGQSAAWNLANSGARVVVYSDNGIIFDGNVPVSEQGTTWEVFRIENGSMVVTNNVSFSHPGNLSNNYAVAMSNDLSNHDPIELTLLDESNEEIALPYSLTSDIVDGDSTSEEYEVSEMEEAENNGDETFVEVMDAAEAEREESEEIVEKNEESEDTVTEESEELTNIEEDESGVVIGTQEDAKAEEESETEEMLVQ